VSRLFTLAFVAFVGSATLTGTATARHYDRYDGRWAHEYDNRRDARRAGIVAGAVRTGIAEANTEHRYQECMQYSGYDYSCEQQRYRDEAHARRAGLRTAVIVGAAVRD
jgi:hypothetical protein